MFLRTVCVLWIGLAGAAVAQTAAPSEAIPTAARDLEGGAPTSASNTPASTAPILLPDHYDLGSNILRSVGPCGAPPKADGKPDRSAHGEVSVGVGTRGYREAGGIVCVPLGDHASATVAIDAGRIETRGWRR